MDDNIRACDESIRDQLINGRANLSVTQQYQANDNDPDVRFAIEESLRMYEKEIEMNEQVSKLKQEQIQKQQEEEEIEQVRVQSIREKLGLVIARLKTIFSKDSVAQDLLQWIEWECTPTHLLTSFRPETKSTIHEMKTWIKKNLNPAMQKILEDQRFF
jgi:hypothetical protein